MTAASVVDLDVWRERARVLRSGEAPGVQQPPPGAAVPGAAQTAGAAAGAAAGASVLRMPPPAAGPGPLSPFGPVMAFGLVRRTAPAPPLTPTRLTPVPPPPPVLKALPPLSCDPGATSAPAPRQRAALDTRGTPRGPRR